MTKNRSGPARTVFLCILTDNATGPVNVVMRLLTINK